MKKKILSIFLAITLLLTLAQGVALAEDIKDLTADKGAFAEAVQSATHSIGPKGSMNASPYTIVYPGETIGIIPEFSANDMHTYGTISYRVWQLDNPVVDTEYLTESEPAKTELTPLVRGSDNVQYSYFGTIKEVTDGSPETFTYIGVYRNDTGLPIAIGNGGLGGEQSLSMSGRGILENNGAHVDATVLITNKPTFHFIEPSYKFTVSPYADYYGEEMDHDLFYWPGGEPTFPTSYTVDGETRTYDFPVPVIKGMIVEYLNFYPGGDPFGSDRMSIGDKREEGDMFTITRDETGYHYTVNAVNCFLMDHFGIVGYRWLHDQQVSYSTGSGYTVGFNGNGGTIGGKTYVVKEAETRSESGFRSGFLLDISTVQAEWEGHTFLGWGTDKDNPRGTLITDTDPEKSSSWRCNTDIENHTELYAAWDPDDSQTDKPTDESTDPQAKGWLETAGGWTYIRDDGTKATGWMQDGATWYYFDADGVMKTGWMQDGTTWYYFDDSGAMATGTRTIDGTEYTFDSSGAWLENTAPAQTGWVQDGGSWYYYDANGAKKTGWISDGGAWYYMKSGGAMATGWTKAGGSWYYFRSSGTMMTGWFEDKDAENALPAGQKRAI